MILFLSGHGDHRGLHVSGELLPWETLEAAVRRIPARVVIALVDACQSGAFLTPKGLSLGPPLSVSLVPAGPEGKVLITSSGANEASHESSLLQGSPFAVFLISGLRGGADLDRDRAITVEELYRYLYERTVAATLSAPLGPQHPYRRIETAGAGPVVLARHPPTGTAVRRAPRSKGSCFVLDRAEARVLAELGPGEEQAVSIPEQPIVVKCLEGDTLVAAAVASWSGTLVLDELALTAEPHTFALVKGPEARRWPEVIAAAALASRDRELGLSLSVRYGSSQYSLGAEVSITARRRAWILGGGGFVLPWLQIPEGRLEVGMVAGGRAGRDGGALAFGPYAQLVVGLGGVVVSGRINLLTGFAFDQDTFFVAVGSIGFGVGNRDD